MQLQARENTRLQAIIEEERGANFSRQSQKQGNGGI